MPPVNDAIPILVVDDDEPTQKLVEALLHRHGYTTAVASNGREAIEVLRKKKFAGIVLDLMMPHVGGLDVIAFLEAESMRVPVIVCTAAPPTRTVSLNPVHVKAVIRKPFDIDDFIATVKAVTGIAWPQPRVLIVDDNMSDRYVLRTFLSPANAFEAESGEAALELMDETRPDVVLLDLMLPGLQGEDLLRILRERAETTSVPVIVVTSKLLSEEERQQLLVYAAGVIYKGDLSRQAVRDAMKQAMRT
jgi:CheY-like chemotaxis protein